VAVVVPEPLGKPLTTTTVEPVVPVFRQALQDLQWHAPVVVVVVVV
jgi:hypothetical protein